MKNSKKLWQRATLPLALICLSVSLAGCFGQKVVILNDSEVITPHPYDDTKVCMDKGYLVRIYEACGVGEESWE